MGLVAINRWPSRFLAPLKKVVERPRKIVVDTVVDIRGRSPRKCDGTSTHLCRQRLTEPGFHAVSDVGLGGWSTNYDLDYDCVLAVAWRGWSLVSSTVVLHHVVAEWMWSSWGAGMGALRW